MQLIIFKRHNAIVWNIYGNTISGRWFSTYFTILFIWLILKSEVKIASRPDGSLSSDCIFGHCLIDISTVLPFDDDNFEIRISQTMYMKYEETHHIGSIKVTKSLNIPLKVVLCSYDTIVSSESLIPIKYNLDLFIIYR